MSRKSDSRFSAAHAWPLPPMLGLWALGLTVAACAGGPNDNDDLGGATSFDTGAEGAASTSTATGSEGGETGNTGSSSDATSEAGSSTSTGSSEGGTTTDSDSSSETGSTSSDSGSSSSDSGSSSTSTSTSDSGEDTTDDGGDDGGVCDRPMGSCDAPEVTVTEIDLGVAITDYGNEWDTLPLPMAIAAMPSGHSRLAARGTDGQIHIAELDCEDNLVGQPFSLPAVDLQDLHADENGGVVMLTRDAMGSGADNCGEGPLCGGTSAPCYNSFLVRFDGSGNELWSAMVTNADANLDPYTDGARYVWEHYQHHGRIAFDGTNYAAYFCIGITVNNGSCVDIHEGDRMQVVDGGGGVVMNHPDAFGVGCSHSWNTRIVWDPRTSRFVMVCATDNDCRIAQPNPYRTVASGECDGTLFGGDLVLSSTPGYWTAWSQGEQIRLEHFTDGASDTTIMNAGASQHPHLVSYGPEHMLLAWEAGSGMAAQVRDAGTGQTVGAEFTIDVDDHNYMAFKAYADGSVAYPAAGSTATSVRIARVMPCSD